MQPLDRQMIISCLFELFEHISRSTPVSIWQWPPIVCMAKALVGVGTDRMMLGHDKTKANEWQSVEEVAFNRDTIQGMQGSANGSLLRKPLIQVEWHAAASRYSGLHFSCCWSLSHESHILKLGETVF